MVAPFTRVRHRQFLALPLLLLSFTAELARAQTCYGIGSAPLPATVQAGPSLLACPNAAPWPVWHLWTPGHRAPVPHPGFNPGNARELPRLLVTYRCTGLLLVPILPAHIRTLGYVIDQPEVPCDPAATTS